MHSFLDAKTMARILRQALADRGVAITHSESLELVARQFGLADWNTLAAAIERSAQPALPAGWYRTGTTSPNLHRMGPDPQRPGTLKIQTLADAETVGSAFGSLAHTIAAAEYRGGTIRFRAELTGSDCTNAAIWMRIDSAEPRQPLRFDNLQSRLRDGPLTGSFDWTPREIVLDVPEAADKVLYGVMLIGTGTMWARNIDVRPGGVAGGEALVA